MKIEVWSDFVCPFCYIGKRRLENALKQFAHSDDVTVAYKSYQLMPEGEYKPELNYYETLSALKGMPVEQAKAMNEQLGKQAAEVGLTYNFDTMKFANTFDAHRVAKYAQKQGKGNEMTERLLYAHFTESKLLSDNQTLAGLAADVGLDKSEVLDVLHSNRFARDVREDIDVANQIGVQGVPFFVFNEAYAVSGAQPAEVFGEVLQKVWEEEQKRPVIQTLNPEKSETSYCTDDGCESN